VPHIKETAKILFDNKITCLEWPGKSADLNPKENNWAVFKDMLKIWIVQQEKMIWDLNLLTSNTFSTTRFSPFLGHLQAILGILSEAKTMYIFVR
jgi:hypothetical protein